MDIYLSSTKDNKGKYYYIFLEKSQFIQGEKVHVQIAFFLEVPFQKKKKTHSFLIHIS